MQPLVMPLTTWDTINTLCFDRKVLHVGVADGNDVVSLAQAALVVAVYVDVAAFDIGVSLAKIAQVDDMLVSRGLASRVLLHAVPATLGITQYHRGQFDVAVYNPGACTDPEPHLTIAQLAEYANKVIVVGDGIPQLWDVACSAFKPGTYTASSDGSAIFITLGAPEPIVRTD
jgi:hypothetical protein